MLGSSRRCNELGERGRVMGWRGVAHTVAMVSTDATGCHSRHVQPILHITCVASHASRPMLSTPRVTTRHSFLNPSCVALLYYTMSSLLSYSITLL